MKKCPFQSCTEVGFFYYNVYYLSMIQVHLTLMETVQKKRVVKRFQKDYTFTKPIY